jgi:hypothetical protein
VTPSPIRFALTEVASTQIMEAITARSALIASTPDVSYAALECRWREIGGMLELARRLDAWRLVRALEAHKDALRRQMEILSGGLAP